MFSSIRWLAIFYAFQSSLWAADNPRHVDLGQGLINVLTLEQNWTDDESNQFYNAPQGSRLLPYKWFLHLEQARSEELFRNANHIRELGYIPRTADPQNPDYLPIGFVKDAPYDDGTEGLGMTCAACHTGQINYNGTAIVVDGGPALGDLERLLKGLAASLQITADDDAKFQRFASSVLPTGESDATKIALRASVRSVAGRIAEYGERNLSEGGNKQFGAGRVDAFGAIFNEVSVTFLGKAENWHRADAPVSYPCLWDAPHHDRVQWNGAAENRTSPLGSVLFGTTEVGALGRNAGEVMGVFGHVDINSHELLVPMRYGSTVNRRGLMEIEDSLKMLWSPEWPEELFGAIDPNMRDKGEAIFMNRCSACHKSIDRSDPDRTVVAKLRSVGTDQKLNENFGRMADTGRLQNRLISLTSSERFRSREPIGVILKHVVERAILKPSSSPFEFQETLAESP